jgi:hypothetical protein
VNVLPDVKVPSFWGGTPKFHKAPACSGFLVAYVAENRFWEHVARGGMSKLSSAQKTTRSEGSLYSLSN